MEKEKTLKNLRDGAFSLGIHLTELQLKQYFLYYEMLVEKNKVMNLTAITEWDEVVSKHFLDSLSLLKCQVLNNERLIDVGTGAGFPGIPLKIAFPSLSVTLFDSLKKRLDFLEEVISTLQLSDIRTVHGRAEELGHRKEHREAYDLCVSRAVAPLPVLSEYCLPLVKLHGRFISYKGGEFEEELAASERAVSLLGGEKKDPLCFTLYQTEQKRSLIVIEKRKETPALYPRRPGIPKKKPL
ncbi:MAG: 16S rRNA (guanine(527)-N(7))-methyltransferase RsmG [Lachnospiraceae bacterium]|nr:16S rRNA (guanine(527)-N(7))-methyltransferase RsmG [Lachnospiraceae bacterium]